MDLYEQLEELREVLAEREALLCTLEKQCADCNADVFRLRSQINLTLEEICWHEQEWQEFDNSQRE